VAAPGHSALGTKPEEPFQQLKDCFMSAHKQSGFENFEVIWDIVARVGMPRVKESFSLPPEPT